MSLAIWETLGVVFITILGVVWHFVFGWGGKWWPLALIFPVNESVWEHLKLAFWPALLFAAVQYIFLQERPQNFYIAKVLSALIGPLGIVLFFYGYTAILGRHVLLLDILSLPIAVAVAQWISYRVLTSTHDLSQYNGLATFALAAALVAFLSLSFFPPRWNLFLDRPSGGYGIIP